MLYTTQFPLRLYKFLTEMFNVDDPALLKPN